MSDPTPQELAYMRAAEIANALLGDGIPVVGFGARPQTIWMHFQLEDQPAGYFVRLKMDDATPKLFRHFYEAVA